MLFEHRVSVTARLGVMLLDVAIDLRSPWTVLFGPSGSGKSSVLRGMCGLLDGAEVKFTRDGERLDGLAVEQRDLSYAPQGAVVFPHLTVSENVEFGVVVRGDSAKDVPRVEEAMQLFRLHEMGERRAVELSGGERQRVALARAFARPGAKLMVLDEPFAGLDRGLRDELLPEMQALLLKRGVPCVSVTHDVDEAVLLGAEVVRMEAGRVVGVGAAREVLAGEMERMMRALG